MAHSVLEAAGLTPAWIEERKEIDRAVDVARARFHVHWRSDPAQAEADFREVAARLNRRILAYNLHVPAGGFQRTQVDVAWEIERAAIPYDSR
ncbi:MAG: hypothetical protein JOZ39_11245 [Chloroflexi bacterium]|nr:hypothetical protein [Chloroflexota bacterium]